MCIVPTSFCYVNIWDGFALTTYQYKKIISCSKAVGAASKCYWDELMLLKCELMLLKCELMILKCEVMLLKPKINTKKSANIVLRNW